MAAWEREGMAGRYSGWKEDVQALTTALVELRTEHENVNLSWAEQMNILAERDRRIAELEKRGKP